MTPRVGYIQSTGAKDVLDSRHLTRRIPFEALTPKMLRILRSVRELDVVEDAREASGPAGQVNLIGP